MIKLSEILKSSKKRLEAKKSLMKPNEIKPPDRLEWDEAKRFLLLPDRAKEELLKKDVVKYDRLIELGNKVYERWQSWFMSQSRNVEHPFVKGINIQRWKLPIGEYFSNIEKEMRKER